MSPMDAQFLSLIVVLATLLAGVGKQQTYILNILSVRGRIRVNTIILCAQKIRNRVGAGKSDAVMVLLKLSFVTTLFLDAASFIWVWTRTIDRVPQVSYRLACYNFIAPASNAWKNNA